LHVFSSYCRQVASRKSFTGEKSTNIGRPVVRGNTPSTMHVHNSKQQFEKTHNQSKSAQKNPMLL
jgi:hypothetical protein